MVPDWMTSPWLLIPAAVLGTPTILVCSVMLFHWFTSDWATRRATARIEAQVEQLQRDRIETEATVTMAAITPSDLDEQDDDTLIQDSGGTCRPDTADLVGHHFLRMPDNAGIPATAMVPPADVLARRSMAAARRASA